jgi:hypothetical protein
MAGLLLHETCPPVHAIFAPSRLCVNQLFVATGAVPECRKISVRLGMRSFSLLLSDNSERTAKEIFSDAFSGVLLEIFLCSISALSSVFAVIR